MSDSACAILPRAVGEGRYAKRGGGGGARFSLRAFARGEGYSFLRDLVLYGLASVAALAVDWATLTFLILRGIPTPMATAVGFLIGMAITYVASITLVYADRRQGSKVREAVVFVVIGLAGLGLSEALILAFAGALGLAAPIAKAPTACVVFLFNFAARRAMLFAAPAP